MTRSAAEQQQFLNVIDRDEAERRFRGAVRAVPSQSEVVSIVAALGRVLACDVTARVDVPCFDRSNLDGFAVRAADTYGAEEEHPVRLRLLDEVIQTAVVPQSLVGPGDAVTIATGGMVPRGADAIVMVEHTDIDQGALLVHKPVTPGRGLCFAGTDIAAGETVYRQGELLTSRETGVLAAIGVHQVLVWRRPRVAIISTGDEIIGPEQPMQPGLVFDSNAQVLADAVRELGGEPVRLGIVPDDLTRLREVVAEGVQTCDVVLLSGGTSKGAGDLSYRVVQEFTDPGVLAHGVALKPGKPICLAVTQGKPVVILPGFPTSAIFTFHEFVSPVILGLAGLPEHRPGIANARLAMQVNSEIGRTEYLLVGLVQQIRSQPAGCTPSQELVAYPMGKGSGSVTTFALADGFVTIGRHEEILSAGSNVAVTLLGRDLLVADFVVIGSHCVGLDLLLGKLHGSGVRTKFLAVGSTAGLRAVERGECDLAGIHLLDPFTNTYNVPWVTDGLELIRGYQRQQGLVFRPEDVRFHDKSTGEILAPGGIVDDPKTLMVNRNQGSGTRILIDQLLGGREPHGYAVQSRSHNAVVASIAQHRSDWGVAIEEAARQAGLAFLPLRAESYDFVVRRDNASTMICRFRELLASPEVRQELWDMHLRPETT